MSTIDSASSSPGSTPKDALGDRRLICCASCQTWIPADRAVGGRAGVPAYCSTECIEKPAAEKKLAG